MSGIWPIPASKAPVLKAGHEGTKVDGCQMWKEGR